MLTAVYDRGCQLVDWSMQVIKLISQVIADFADGEIDQSDSLFDTETTLQVSLNLY